MAWSTPLTAVSNSPLTAAQWNASVRDNLLETAPAKFSSAGQLFVSTGANAGAARNPTAALVSTSETTTSSSYTDLATIGPTVTVTTGTRALVALYASILNSGNNNTFMSVDLSGATVLAAADAFAIAQFSSAGGRIGSLILFNMSPGSTTFTGKYRTAAGTATFADRRMLVIPL